MPITYKERPESGAVTQDENGAQTITKAYTVYDAPDGISAIAAVPDTTAKAALTGYSGYTNRGGTCTPLIGRDPSSEDYGAKVVSFNYSNAALNSSSSSPIDPARGTVSVNLSPVTVNIKTCPPADAAAGFAGQTKYGTDAQDFGLMMGVQSDPAAIVGIDIQKLAYQIDITKYYNLADIYDQPPAWKTIIENSMRMNDSVFNLFGDIEFAAGEVLFLGASANQTYQTATTTYAEYNYQFLVSLNSSEDVTLTKEDGTTETVTVSKRGWDVQWAAPILHVSGVSDVTATVTLRGVYIADVYGKTDLSAIDFYLEDPLIGPRSAQNWDV